MPMFFQTVLRTWRKLWVPLIVIGLLGVLPGVSGATPGAADAAYKEAIEAGTLTALEKFLRDYPDAPEADDVKDRVAWAREDQAYTEAMAAGNERAYEKFLSEFPDAVFHEEVKLRLALLRQLKAKSAARVTARAHMREVFVATEDLNTADAYRVYLLAFPDTTEAEKARERLVKLEEETAPPSQNRSTAAFAEAVAQHSIQAMEKFLQDFPGAPESAEAKERIEWYQEDAAYEAALSQADEDGYRGFIAAYPESVLREEVELRLRALEEKKARDEAKAQARKTAAQRREEIYSEVSRVDTAGAYQFFLAAYPDSPEAVSAEEKLQVIQEDDTAFLHAQESEEGLRGYLAERPGGRHAAEAKSRLQSIRQAAMDGAFKEAVAMNTVEALNAFLRAHGDGPYAKRAKALVRELRKRNPTLSVVFTSEPPAFDGKADDAAWRDAPVSRIPLSGGEGPSSVRLRAVHDGKKIYLLARWADETPSDQYRPWVWDADRQTYAQTPIIDDGFAVRFYKGRPPGVGEGRGPGPVEADEWLWRAFWSKLSGRAEDSLLTITTEEAPEAASNPSPGGGTMWVNYGVDDGTPGWSFYMPRRKQGPEVPSHRRAPASGSRADVKALGDWESGTWTVEFVRALDTHQPDDLALQERGKYPVSFCAFEQAEKGIHSTSQVVQLDVQPQ